MSEGALAEYKELKEGFQEEAVCRVKAEQMASKVGKSGRVRIGVSSFMTS